MRYPLRLLLLLAPLTPALAQAPQPVGPPNSIGSVEVSAATISGTLTLSGDRALIGSNAVVTARDRTATVRLTRGGEILVCTTSVLHAARADTHAEPAPLLLALDHGAVEIHMAASTRDSIVTPDLRFSVVPPSGPALQGALAGILDLRMRVAPNGDTCIQNQGDHAPTLEAFEQFGSGLYRIGPGQHLLFEHGSLREVVDNESSPCGCPPPPTLSVASNGISTDVTRAARPGSEVADDRDEVRPHDPTAAESHPFPAAESQGLTPTQNAAAIPQAPPNQPHAQVAATLAFTPSTTPDAPPANLTSNTPATSPTTSKAAPAPSASVPASAAPSPLEPPQGSPGPTPASPESSAPSAVASAPTTPAPNLPAAASAAPPPSPAPQPVPKAKPAHIPTPAPASPLASAQPSAMRDPDTTHEIAQAPLQPAAPPPHDLVHAISHFFHHLFGSSAPQPHGQSQS